MQEPARRDREWGRSQKAPLLIAMGDVPSASACASKCVETTSCVAFSTDAALSKCALYSVKRLGYLVFEGQALYLQGTGCRPFVATTTTMTVPLVSTFALGDTTASTNLVLEEMTTTTEAPTRVK